MFSQNILDQGDIHVRVFKISPPTTNFGDLFSGHHSCCFNSSITSFLYSNPSVGISFVSLRAFTSALLSASSFRGILPLRFSPKGGVFDPSCVGIRYLNFGCCFEDQLSSIQTKKVKYQIYKEFGRYELKYYMT